MLPLDSLVKDGGPKATVAWQLDCSTGLLLTTSLVQLFGVLLYLRR